MLGDFFSTCWRRLFLGNSSQRLNSRQAPRRPLLLQLENLEDRVVPTVSPNDLFVGTAYAGLLGRAVDPTGLATWSPRLNLGSPATTHQVVSFDIATSPEAMNRDVQLFYQTFLARPADPAGQAYWVSQLESGATLNQVKAGFLGSGEFFGLVGSTNQNFLGAVYQLELGRPIDSAGLNFWLNELTVKGESRTTVAEQILASPEANNEKVTNFYMDILGRTPSAAEVAYWSNQLSAGTNELTVVSDFFASNEYLTEITNFAGSTTATTAAGAASLFVTGPPALFTGPLPNAEELAGNVLTLQNTPYVIAKNDTYNVTFNVPLGVSTRAAGVLGNDVDSTGLPLGVSNPGNFATPKGSLLLKQDGTFVYTPDNGASGTDTATYTATDGTNVSGVATITFNITNPGPVAMPIGYLVPYNTPLTESNAAQGILANDFDPDGQAIVVTNPGSFQTPKGTVAVNANGTFTYIPDGGASGQDTFSYTVSDVQGVSQSAVVYFTIVAQNGTVSDRYDPNETSNAATDFGLLQASNILTYPALFISPTSAGLPDYAWYKWTMSSAGTFNTTLSTTSGGPLVMNLYTLQNGTLSLMGSTTNSTALSLGVALNQVIYVEVLGQNNSPGVTTTGGYNLTVTLNP